MSHKIITFTEWIDENQLDVMKAILVSISGWVLIGMRWLCLDVIGINFISTSPETLILWKMIATILSSILTLVGILYMLWRWHRDIHKFDHWKDKEDENK